MRSDGIRRGFLEAALVAALATVRTSSTPAAELDPAAGGRFRAMVDRPLFSTNRRPPPPVPARAAVPTPPDVPPPGPDLTLSGVISGGGGGVALLKRSLDAAPTRVALGGQIDGWTLAELHPRAVVLRRGGRSATVDLPVQPR